MKRMPINNSNQRSAFTLVELLIVMSIIVLIAAVTLPTIKDLLKDQKSSQTARVVQGFADACRARAIGSGRPVAMIIERLPPDPDGSRDLEGEDTSTRLSVGEVFPPYEGDWANARATINFVPANPPTTTRDQYYADIALTEGASLWDVFNDIPSGLATSGDSISFGDSRRLFRITGIDGPTTVPGFIRIYFDNPPYDEDAGITTAELAIFPPNPMRFRIHRKPSKSLVGGVSLPRGMCIDLSCSGGGTAGVDFGTAAIAASTRASGDPAQAHAPGAYGPVYIVFNPSGSVQEIYYALTPDTSAPFVEPALVYRSVGSNIHLLVGKTEQVFPATLSYLGSVVIPSPAVSERDDVRYNVLDPANYWVTINPFSGSVTAAQVQDQSAFPAIPASTTLTAVELLDLRVTRSRALASSGTQRVDP